MNVYFVYKVLTNRIRALIRAAGYIVRVAISAKTTALAFMVLSVWHAILILPKISSDNFQIYFTQIPCYYRLLYLV